MVLYRMSERLLAFLAIFPRRDRSLLQTVENWEM